METRQSFLKNIADVRIGLTLRGPDASKQVDEGGLHLLKISDITEGGMIHIKSPQPIAVTPSMDRFKVAPGDIVVANRGTRMTAAMVNNEVNAIAGGQTFVIQCDRSKILPEYLWWYLNRPSTQRFLQYRAKGSYVKTIPVSLVREELGIPLPPLETQHQIADFARLALRESEILQELSRLKATYREGIFSEMLTGKALSHPGETQSL